MRFNVLSAVLACLLTACGTTATVQVVKVVVPVPCQAEKPGRPIMPTEQLKPGAPLDAIVQAATAEIERRQGYEDKLEAALDGCIRPLPQETPAPAPIAPGSPA
jgi:hypothetical protein